MYGSWGYYSPIRTLFDAGEGVASALGNYVYAIENVFISHSHYDHIGSLPNLIGARAHARGDKEKPLNVYYHDSHNMTIMKEFILKLHKKLPYELNFIQIRDGFTLNFNNNMCLKAFYVKHAFGSLGFKVLEKRSRLKVGIEPREVKSLLSKGVEVSEAYMGNLFAWTLDSASFDEKNIENCAHWVADSTFLKEKDRDDNTHFSVEEVLTLALKNNVKRLTLAHFSSRYNWNEISPSVLDINEKIGFNGKIDIILPNKVYEI